LPKQGRGKISARKKMTSGPIQNKQKRQEGKLDQPFFDRSKGTLCPKALGEGKGRERDLRSSEIQGDTRGKFTFSAHQERGYILF